MKKYLLPLLLMLAILGLPSFAQAGTCNASYTNSLPQMSGTAGAIPASVPSSIQGLITSVSASGTNLTFGYTPTGGSQSFTVISLGASSGASCSGSWSGAKITTWQWVNVAGTMNTSVTINGVANTLTCTGFQALTASLSWNHADGLQKVFASGASEADLSFAGYHPGTGLNETILTRLVGSCRTGVNSSAVDSLNRLQLYVVATGATSMEFFLNGVSQGSMSGPSPFLYSVPNNPAVGVTLTVDAKATFPIGTLKYPQQPATYYPYKAVAGADFACIRTYQGNAACWGGNDYGQLGTQETGTNYDLPDFVRHGGLNTGTYLTKITDLSAGLQSACAVNNGGVACWGLNTNGILGVTSGTLASSNVPIQVIAQGSNVQKVAVGGKHACALYANGDVKCWGQGTYGQLGNGSTTATVTTPALIIAGVSKLVVARDTSYFKVGGDVWSTGRDQWGQLGNNASLSNISTPVKIITGGTTDLWSGKYHACAKVSGTIKCWGANPAGEAGIGSITPDKVTTPTTATAWNGVSIVDMTGGDSTTCARTTSNELKCLGSNIYGQLGLGYTSSYELTPQTATAYSSGVTSFSASYYNICTYDDGHMWCAGGNDEAQIGDPAASNPQLTPYQVFGF